jgi:hypothetical protein
MSRSWKMIKVFPADGESAPWLEDASWQRCLQLILERLPENERRWIVGLLSLQVGSGGQKQLSAISGLSFPTISKGRTELADDLKSCPSDRVRHKGGGRKLLSEIDDTLIPDLEEMIGDEVAGDPCSNDRWISQSLRDLAKALNKKGHTVGHSTVGRLLKKMGIRCRSTESDLPGHPIPIATRNINTSKKRSASS